MQVEDNIIAMDDEVLNKLRKVLEQENLNKPKGEKLTIRMLPEELALYQHYVHLTEYKNVSDLVRRAVREKIRNIVIPKNPIEQRFLGTWGIHRKIGDAIEKQVDEIENEIEDLVENIDVSSIDEDLLIDFIQKQQVSSAIAISLLRKKKHYL
jgi:Arc/MetJ-type ribon-helix-helix transcriptional regulator